MNIKFRAKKIFSPMQHFYDADSLMCVEKIARITLSRDEECIGLYLNGENDYLLITDKGIYVCNGEKCSVSEFDRIAQVVPSSAEKGEVVSLGITMQDGTSNILPVRYGQGRFKDVFEMERFLRRVCPALRKGQS